MRCAQCRGKKQILGLGFIFKACHVCNGTGEQNDICKTKDVSEQDNIENSQNSPAKTNVDSSAPENGKKRRQVRRKRNTLGVSAEDLSERKESGQSNEEI